MAEEGSEKEMVTPQELVVEPEGFFLRVFKKLTAWILLFVLMSLCMGFLFFVGLAIYRGILWLWPW